MARRNEYNTPIGQMYNGSWGGSGGGGIYAGLDRSAPDDIYHSNDYQFRAGGYQQGVFDNTNPYLFASMNFPDSAPIPTGSLNIPTPFGNFDVGTNDGNKNVYAGYEPNGVITALVQAYLRNMNNRQGVSDPRDRGFSDSQSGSLGETMSGLENRSARYGTYNNPRDRAFPSSYTGSKGETMSGLEKRSEDFNRRWNNR